MTTTSATSGRTRARRSAWRRQGAPGSTSAGRSWRARAATRRSTATRRHPPVPSRSTRIRSGSSSIRAAAAGPRRSSEGRCIAAARSRDLQGTYFFTDYSDDLIRSLEYDPGTGTVSNFQDRSAELDPPGPATLNNISSFGVDGFGELLFCMRPNTLGAGTVHRIVIATAAQATNTFRNGGGTNPTCYSSSSQPIIGNTWRGAIEAAVLPGATIVGVVGRRLPSSGTFNSGGEILVDLGSPRSFQVVRSAGAGGVVKIKAKVPCDPAFNGVSSATQAFRRRRRGGVRAVQRDRRYAGSLLSRPPRHPRTP